MPNQKLYLKHHQLYETVLPYSEVCVHMRVAGTPVRIQLVGDRMVQIYELNGKPFSAPVTRGEAGVYDDEGGPYIYLEAKS